MTKDNQQAVNAFAAALANCNTPQAIESAVSQYMRQWAAQERQIKIYPNGLAKVEVLDKDMSLIAEYTRPAKGIWIDVKDDAGLKYDIIAGVNFPHRLETGKTSAEVDAWCKENNHVRLNRDRQIGNYTAEAVVVPRMVYEHRADLQ